MKKITLSLLSLLVAFGLQAKVTEVNAPADYQAALEAAANGDTLLLTTSGSYKHQLLPAGRVITVMAADTAEVTINGESKFGECDGGGICYENVTISNSGRLFWDSGTGTVGTIELISFKNCDIKDIAYSLLYCAGTDADVCRIKKLVFDNCLIHHTNTASWQLIYMWCYCEELVMNECTYYDQGNSSSLFSTSNKFEGSIKITLTHNTFYIGGDILTLGGNYGGGDCALTMEDNIIVCPDGKTAGCVANMSAGFWDIQTKNNLLVGFTMPTVSEEIGTITSENDYTLEGLGLNAQEIFADAGNSDFTIYSGTPLATASTTGSVLGASRWLKDVQVVNLTQGLAAGVDSLAGTVSGPKGKVEKGLEVTLTAVKNFGYKFVKWVDASNATVSEEAALTFTANEDCEYYAVFEPVNVYKLTLAIDGGGKVIIDVAGKDGGYEYYEEGTVLVLSAKNNLVQEFAYWQGDNDLVSASPDVEITMNGDYSITAYFQAKSYICGFNFDVDKAVTIAGYQADLVSPKYAEQDNKPAWHCYNAFTNEEASYLVGNFFGTYNSYVWKKAPMDGETVKSYYFQTVLNTTGYSSDVIVDFYVCGIYFSWNQVLLQTSYDGLAWETADTIQVTGGFVEHCDTLPYSANKETFYVRFMPNMAGTYSGDPATQNECEAYRDIYFLAEYADALKPVMNDVDLPVRYYNLMGQLVSADTKGVIIRVQGKNAQKIMNR